LIGKVYLYDIFLNKSRIKWDFHENYMCTMCTAHPSFHCCIGFMETEAFLKKGETAAAQLLDIEAIVIVGCGL